MTRREFLALTAAVLADCGARQLVPAARAGETGSTNSVSPAVTVPRFEPVRYRPIAVSVTGLKASAVSLDGAWRVDPAPSDAVRQQPLAAANWHKFQVPGQWAQQGFDIPQDKTAAVATEFSIPAEWAGYRVFLRFNAIHAGTRYWLNGQALGYSENLFTPVEWEITGAAKIGQVNRLDLEMKVATSSERLSNSCGYTGYSLGGIDRSVQIYALPRAHISRLHLSSELDTNYQDGELEIELGLDNPDSAPLAGLSVAAKLFDATGQPVEHTQPELAAGTVNAGLTTLTLRSRVPAPLKWNAEQPNLYRLALELLQDGRVLEQIERNIGFRTIETRNRQLYVNGVRVKLAGVCHHEIDPITGRAGTARHAEDDVKLFKSANLNHVRTSHYPCTQEFLDAADRHGLYVESEAPLCWVQPAKDLADLDDVLRPTSAMVDYNHSHPSVILWSLANESHWSELFAHSNRLCKDLDPTRPTNINHAFTKENKVTCDIMNRHYQNLPYDEILPDDPRPFLHGECYFLVYHERTDVAVNPGLRELWAHGSADTASPWGQSCIDNLKGHHELIPGIYPGAWNYIYHSNRCIGSEIWSGVDDIAYLPDGKVVSSESGNAWWGLIDGWRRPKPELALAKFVFSPVWFPVRQLAYQLGQAVVQIPVENRHSFTDLSQFKIVWQLHGAGGWIRTTLPPGATGSIGLTVPAGTPEGSTLLVRVVNGDTEIVNATLTMGQPAVPSLPQPQAGSPQWKNDNRLVTIQGAGFSLVLDTQKGDFDPTHSGHQAPIASFPSLHLTRHDFGDLDRKKPAYAVLPDAAARVIDGVDFNDNGHALEIVVKDHYDHFAGTIRWLLDREGTGRISYDYAYTGEDLDSRELGVRVQLRPECDELKWRRWSEWGVFPDDCISRTEGRARARRDRQWPDQPASVKPAWPWSQDQTDLGTADFRSIKFCIYEASLTAAGGSGVRIQANADVHFRAALAGGGIAMHLLSRCPLAPVTLKSGDRLAGEFMMRLVPA